MTTTQGIERRLDEEWSRGTDGFEAYSPFERGYAMIKLALPLAAALAVATPAQAGDWWELVRDTMNLADDLTICKQGGMLYSPLEYARAIRSEGIWADCRGGPRRGRCPLREGRAEGRGALFPHP
jgi:hypothetical protein